MDNSKINSKINNLMLILILINNKDLIIINLILAINKNLVNLEVLEHLIVLVINNFNNKIIRINKLIYKK